MTGKNKYCPVPYCSKQELQVFIRKHWKLVHVPTFLRIVCPAPDCNFECAIFKEMPNHMKTRHKDIFHSPFEAMYYFLEFEHIAELLTNADFVDPGDVRPSAIHDCDCSPDSLFPMSLPDNPENRAVVHSKFNQFASFNIEFMIFESCKSYGAKITHLKKERHSLAGCGDEGEKLPEPKIENGPPFTRHHAMETVRKMFMLYCGGLPQQVYGLHPAAGKTVATNPASPPNKTPANTKVKPSVATESKITKVNPHTSAYQPEDTKTPTQKTATAGRAGSSTEGLVMDRLADIKAREAELLSNLQQLKGGSGGNRGGGDFGNDSGANCGTNRSGGNRGNQGSSGNKWGDEGAGGGYDNFGRNQDGRGGNWGNNQEFGSNYGSRGRGRSYGGGPMKGGNYYDRSSGPYGGGHGGNSSRNYGRGGGFGGNYGGSNYYGGYR